MAEDAKKEAVKDGAPEGQTGTPEEQQAAAAAAAAGKKKKLLMFGAAGVAVLGVAVMGAVVFLNGGGEDAQAEGPKTEVPAVAFVAVPEFTVNLLSDGGKSSFLRLKVSVELGNAADAEAFNQLLPKLQDDWGAFLRQLRPLDLQGTAALARVKEGLLRRANQTLEPLVVKDVLITEMLVQ